MEPEHRDLRTDQMNGEKEVETAERLRTVDGRDEEQEQHTRSAGDAEAEQVRGDPVTCPWSGPRRATHTPS